MEFLFDICLLEEKQKTSPDAVEGNLRWCVQTLGAYARPAFFEDKFDKANNGEFDEFDRIDLVGELRRIAENNLTNEEYAALKRLEFVFALAVTVKESGGLGDLIAGTLVFYGHGTIPRASFAPTATFSPFTTIADMAAQTFHDIFAEDHSESISTFKKQILWDVIGDERPQSLDEFKKLLNTRGFFLLHSA